MSDRPEQGLAEQLFVVDRDQLRSLLEARRAETASDVVDVTEEGRFRVISQNDYGPAEIAEALRDRGHAVPDEAWIREAENGAIAMVWSVAL